MANPENVEKVRQEIMRFRELLNIMHLKLDEGERAYGQLFSNRSPEEMQNMKEKDLQGKVAEEIIGDLTPLSKAVLKARFGARELERAFEELYDIIVTVLEEP
jgi:hypothetical protein